ncbi:serine dehydratase subunit alpha family protein [Allofournierella sp.]|uniref:L-cysteine desulfidase family protein n=1 Tax=Allofournierella sp. TaxID=1940256 RepID=UPI003AEF93F9
MDKTMFFRILNSEMELATGCTEPGAIALTGAYAGAELNKLGEAIQRMEVKASTNIIKNAMAAGIPGTSYTGMPYAAAIGAAAAAPERKLEVINGVSDDVYKAAELLVETGKVNVELAKVPQKLYIDVIVYGPTHSARAVIADLHTNLVLLEVDGKEVFKADPNAPVDTGRDVVTPEEIAAFLTVRKIYDFCDKELDPMNDPIDIIRSAISVNGEICERGMEKDYGLAIGPNLERNCRAGVMTRDMVTNSMIITTAGADARMAGAPFSVVANSGSGNQGITTTMPVVSLAKWKEIPEDKMVRAVTLSNLIAIRIKSKFGRLSAMCGASVAGTGAACGITYLLGGGYDEICRAIHNMIGDVTGMLCDGAKADCSLKISTCVNAAFQAAFMAMRGVRVESTDGIVEDNVEYTIDNFAKLGNEGSGPMDAAILEMMLNKREA